MGVTSVFGECYHGRRVLLTGHTGFKGSWLALWLKEMGAQVTGVALDPETTPNHWDLLKLDIDDRRADIRDAGALARIIGETRPEIVFHLAAQSLVRRSYREPRLTWETNVGGTVNLLEACRAQPSVRAIVIVTTDKCYENKESAKGYTEDDRLGGHDPYSASKAAAEMVAASYRDALFKDTGAALIATARAGNVIGGGDWAEDRIIPDLARACAAGKPLEVRSPTAVRPWQHVLEPLAGYLMLGQRLFEGKKEFAQAWNFGPDESGAITVAGLLGHLQKDWPGFTWNSVKGDALHETTMLKLDSSKARTKLGWKPTLSTERQISMTAEWYRAWLERGAALSREQLALYMKAAA